MAITITEEETCSGCTACQAICPVGCISMEPDGKGFLYPSVDMSRCIGCNLCEQVCPLRRKRSGTSTVRRVYAARNKDPETLRRSSSGGVFVPLSDAMLERGGTVYGASFAEDLEVCHRRCTTAGERDLLVGSKYVQSNMGPVLCQVREDLKQGLPVLFTGTPCQIAGLQAYLAKTRTDTADLVTCDLFCYGVPSPMVWKDYLQTLGKPVFSASFRDKTHGWADFSMRLETQTGTSVETGEENPFLRLYFAKVLNRPSCLSCRFTSLQRTGDLTIGDYWGIERTMPDFADRNGVSVILVNSEKGSALLGQAADALLLRESDVDSCMQEVLRSPSGVPQGYTEFWKRYAAEGFPVGWIE
jgi:coenzyme F420-reducing hydrogenase beta subunit